jgi:hypothetical protein
VSIAAPGHARFTVAEMSLRDFAFPPVAVKRIARRVAGAGEDGAFLVPVPSAVRALRLGGDGLVLYRSERQ